MGCDTNEIGSSLGKLHENIFLKLNFSFHIHNVINVGDDFNDKGDFILDCA